MTGIETEMKAQINLGALQGELDRLLTALGYELVRLRYLSHTRRGHLELLIDKPGGVTLADCEGVSRQVGPYLDVLNAVPQRYTLEVSSPGVNRPLTKEEDLQANLGRTVALRLAKQQGGSRRLKGILKGVAKDALEMEVKGRCVSIPRESIQESTLVYDWDAGQGSPAKGPGLPAGRQRGGG